MGLLLHIQPISDLGDLNPRVNILPFYAMEATSDAKEFINASSAESVDEF
jgi:hypothetical protein